ncbi:hypothetical protein [Synechococcus sp. M16CYN]|uniref:hypothetical protein n=1 Tax=Synechococcus sp. M16CYN TaxID=3103139 RepID=UPI0030E4D395
MNASDTGPVKTQENPNSDYELVDELYDPVGPIVVDKVYDPATPLNVRKASVLEHSMFMEKALTMILAIVVVVGALSVFYTKSSSKEQFGSLISGVALGALANKLKDQDINPD